jgi:hypothetical protein
VALFPDLSEETVLGPMPMGWRMDPSGELLTNTILATEPVVVPSQEVLNSFTNIVGPLIERTHLTQIREISTLHGTLLPRLTSGQLKLPEVANEN